MLLGEVILFSTLGGVEPLPVTCGGGAHTCPLPPIQGRGYQSRDHSECSWRAEHAQEVICSCALRLAITCLPYADRVPAKGTGRQLDQNRYEYIQYVPHCALARIYL